MGENVDPKRTFSLSEAAISFLKFLIFLEVLVPHLKAFCITMRDKPWEAAGPIDVTDASKEAVNAA